MKKQLLVVVAVCGLLSLVGCNNRPAGQDLSADAAGELKPMQQSYRGIFPCADCEGIETDLFLEKQGTWVMNMHYLGRGTSFASYGTWQRTADKLVLTASDGEKIYFLVKQNDQLEKLDIHGQPIQSSLNFTLRATALTLPTTPMAMKGEYTYLADAAIFKDCQTGKTTPVQSNASVQQQYLKARGNSAGPVLLEIDGYFSEQPKPDSPQMENVLVPSGKVHFLPGQRCNASTR